MRLGYLRATQSSMRYVWTTPTPPLRRRLALAAAAAGRDLSAYCRLLLEQWKGLGIGVPGEPARGQRRARIRIPVGEGLHEALRTAAARREITLDEATVCILDSLCPHEVELLAQAITNEGPGPATRRT